jgi:hypothetical protein
MKEIKHKDDAVFNSASMTRNEFASLQSLKADRDAHMEKAAHLARSIYEQVVTIDQDERANPIYMYTRTTEGVGTEADWARGQLCIENLKGLKSSILNAFEVQDQIWELEDQIWVRNPKRLDSPYPTDRHFADKFARKLLVSVRIHLGLDDHEKTDRTTDYAESMSTQEGENPKAEELYCAIACQSVTLMRVCLAQFLKVWKTRTSHD